ncbi:MAG: ATP synthase F0 subunit C [Candidatus Aminicenantales bacterium]
MREKSKHLALLFFLLVILTGSLLAQEAETTAEKGSIFKVSIIVGGAIITIAASAGAFSQAKAITSACEGISRNPGSAPHIRFIVMLGLVLIETLVIYALFITIIILMIKWGQY